MRKRRIKIIWALMCVLFLFTGCTNKNISVVSVNLNKELIKTETTVPKSQYEWLSEVPEYTDVPYAKVNDDKPFFSEEDYSKEAFESYADLDEYGRCGVAYALVGVETMPTEGREDIGMIKPSGWHTVRYDDIIEDKYLYNRCHLIAFQLTGKNAEPKNLITGTRYMNVEGMLPFENKVASYINETKNHVLYRVTPIFEGRNLIARGVLMEAYSVEDNGKGITFNVYCYNVQPGIGINYADGDSWVEAIPNETEPVSEVENRYILNKSSKKFHKPECEYAKKMSNKNKEEYKGSRDEVIASGYVPCKVCKP